MTTLLEYAVAGFERNSDMTLATLSEWSLCCMTALRAKDVDCKTAIHLVTKKTIEKLLLNLNLETTRPWTSVKKIEEEIRSKFEVPLRETLAKANERSASLYDENRLLKERIAFLEVENTRLQSELLHKPKAWFSK
jgi:uncharacterized small protein (DUF1192 family)